MADKTERDAVTGQPTTGHVWNGIKELNTPLPRWWVWVFIATVVWSIGYWVVMPAWPLISSYTTGIYNYSSRADVNADVEAALAAQGEMLAAINDTPLSEIGNDPALEAFAFASGRSSFALHCSQCHGLGGEGAYGIPSLTDDAWIWGGDLESIYQTIRFGVRDEHPETRFNFMPAYLGEFGLLSEDEARATAAFVLTLSSGGADFASPGGEVYVRECAMCHGDAGEGLTFMGGPALNDAIWLYGGAEEEIYAQIANPTHGMMPAWEDRLSPETLKKLAIYVHSLGVAVKRGSAVILIYY